MNEILQKRIEEAARDIAELCPDCDLHCKGQNPCIPKILYQKLVEISIFALQNQWISVEEALPTLDEKYDFSERYIVRTQNNEIKVMRIFRNIAWCDIYRGGAYIPFEKDIVTHWMPIPSLGGGEE